MSCARKLPLCDYCKRRDDHCPAYSGLCFVQTEEARRRLADMTAGQGHDGILYRIGDEKDLALVRAVRHVDWDNYEQYGPGVYEQYYDDSCAYAMPTENLEFRRPL